MTQKLLCLIAGCCFGLSAFAEDLTQRVEDVVTQTKEQVSALEDRADAQPSGEEIEGRGERTYPYLVGKYFTSAGASTQREGQAIKGEGASGFGFDLGYPLGSPWALELGYQAGGGKATTAQAFRPRRATVGTDANYSDLSLSGVYHRAWGPAWVWIGKLGLIQETASLSILTNQSNQTATSWTGAVGGQYFLDRHQALVLEWERNGLPDNPRAYSLFVGFKFAFGP